MDRRGYGRRRQGENTDERDPTQRNDTSSPVSLEHRPAIMKAPVILMKPQRPKKDDEDEEEWPSVGQTSSRTGTPVRRLQEASGADDYVERNERYEANNFRRPVVPPTPIPSYIQQKTSVNSSGDTLYRDSSSGPSKPLRGGIRLITESMEWSEVSLDYLQDQPNFLVVGILGPQGVGKSTLMSMIGGNDPFDMYRHYIFRPASKECTETSGRQTSGVQLFVNENRVILLDSQAILSSAIIEYSIHSDKRYNYECRTTENYVELESLQIAAFFMQVCHVVILLTDWYVDVNLLKFIQTAEMLKPSMPASENPSGTDHFPHFVLVQNRGRREDFTLPAVKMKCRHLSQIFEKSNLLWSSGVSMKASSGGLYDLNDDLADVNFFTLPDMKPRGTKTESLNHYKGIPDYEVLVRELRNHIFGLPKLPFGTTAQSEKTWFNFAARVWDMTRKSLLLSEYGRMLP